MIDVSRNLPSPPGILVIWDGLGLVAKRLDHFRQPLDDGLVRSR